MTRRIWVERLEDGSWQAQSDDGATLKFGKGEGQFSPVELMQIALAGCTALSSQYAVEHALGEGKGARVLVNGTYDPEEGTYLRFQEDVTVDATSAKPALNDENAKELKERMERHINKGCTVKHTLERGAQVRVTVNVRH
ncbi:OsmC family protein [Gardnerella sp. DNF00354]|jgi:possible redox protein|uniref:OsmC family protein n=5 Tax=Gardnerella vaginalis TaxID=2702 RepID=A0A0J8F923_GARVA|nr:OsmC family protein [Gardnerella vaginalis]CQB86927.1 OsmC-like protein [Chlamydia trachomatis]ADP38628.1 OsmC-like protein [Gardnerella vaginalis ATCC 14019]AEF30836.1 OsmC-like protein [Gardnerella vaginalis HMP9231]AYZ21640.1 OsmC family peroxiredoxin [Gardnerella vaginalis]EGL14179.1 OsmC-like protein [Gardnerella vaginalis 315-A]